MAASPVVSSAAASPALDAPTVERPGILCPDQSQEDSAGLASGKCSSHETSADAPDASSSTHDEASSSQNMSNKEWRRHRKEERSRAREQRQQHGREAQARKKGSAEEQAVRSEALQQHFAECRSPFSCPQPQLELRGSVDFSVGQRPIQVVDPTREMLDPANWDIVCDVRSPAEFEEDHLIGASSCPVMSNDERAEIGTLYRHKSPHEAKRLGAAYVSRNIATILLDRFQDAGPDTRVLVYCWRGGERSAALAHVLARVGLNVSVIKRGYMGYRQQVRECMDALGRWDFRVIGGPTGSGKGKLLECLAQQGAQVIDLEALANHRGSILGEDPHGSQPGQKLWESRLLAALRGFDARRPVWVENEGKMVGRRQVPHSMWDKMQQGPLTILDVPISARVAYLRASYAYFETSEKPMLQAKLRQLARLHGHATVGRWLALSEAGEWDEFVADLLRTHYDPSYARSASNQGTDEEDNAPEAAVSDGIPGTRSRAVVAVPDMGDATYVEVARKLLREARDVCIPES